MGTTTKKPGFACMRRRGSRRFGGAAVALALTLLPFAPPSAAPSGFRWNPTVLEKEGLRSEILTRAIAAWRKSADRIHNPRYLTIIDFGLHSSKRRLFFIDTKTGAHEALLVAHGLGSDPNHDGWARRFSNVEGSKMSSVGAYVTGEIYYGKHGMSLRLDGLETTNDRARERAIVMHGAVYVAPDRKVLGRSWGCPAIAEKHVPRLLPKLAGGSFLYIAR